MHVKYFVEFLSHNFAPKSQFTLMKYFTNIPETGNNYHRVTERETKYMCKGLPSTSLSHMNHLSLHKFTL